MDKINLVTLNSPSSSVAEEYKKLRTHICFYPTEKQIKKIVVTSSLQSEGKSTVSSNLAVTLAQNGHKTLLLDCNLRNPSIHNTFNLSNEKGISNILSNECSVNEVLVKGPIDNLYLITSGTSLINPADLIASQNMQNLLKSLSETYEYIIIDTPPVLMVTDAQILSKYADGTLLVVSSGETDKEAAKKAKDLLERVGGNVLGVVMNKVDKSIRRYFRYSCNYCYENDIQNDKVKSILLHR